METLYGDDLESHAETLAYHFEQAQTIQGTDKLIRYSIMAGEAALEATAVQSALSHFEIALSASDAGEVDAQKARILWGLAQAQAAVLDRGIMQAFDNMVLAFEYYEKVGDVPMIATIVGRQNGNQATVSGGVEIADRALKHIAPGSIEAGRILAVKAGAAWFEHGDAELAYEALDRAAVIAKTNNDERLKMSILATRGTVIRNPGRAGVLDALEATEQALSLASANSDPCAELRAATFGGVWNSGLGRLEEALKHTDRLVEASRRHASNAYGFSAAIQQGLASACVGDWSGVDSAIERTEAFSPQGNSKKTVLIIALAADSQRGYESDYKAMMGQIQASPTSDSAISGMVVMLAIFQQTLPELGFNDAVHDQVIRLGALPQKTRSHGGLMAYGVDAVNRHDMATARIAYDGLMSGKDLLMVGIAIDRIRGQLA